MDSLAKATESKYGLPHGTCRAFALQESNYNASATRVETGYFNTGSRYYANIVRDASQFADKYGCDEITERAYRSISFGCFQVMGENLRSLGYAEITLPKFTKDLPAQFEYFGKFVAPLWNKYHSLAKVASVYNTGSPNKTGRQYVKNVCRYQKKFNY
jgi:hypothetical protein